MDSTVSASIPGRRVDGMITACRVETLDIGFLVTPKTNSAAMILIPRLCFRMHLPDKKTIELKYFARLRVVPAQLYSGNASKATGRHVVKHFHVDWVGRGIGNVRTFQVGPLARIFLKTCSGTTFNTGFFQNLACQFLAINVDL